MSVTSAELLAGEKPKRKRRAAPFVEPIAVERSQARDVLGNIGDEKLYKLVNSGEIESYLDGNKRKYLYASLKAYAARMAATHNKVKEVPCVRPRRSAEST